MNGFTFTPLNSVTTMALLLAADELATIGRPFLVRLAHQLVIFKLALDVSPVGFGGAELKCNHALHINVSLKLVCPLAVHHEPFVAFQLIS